MRKKRAVGFPESFYDMIVGFALLQNFLVSYIYHMPWNGNGL